MRTLFVHQNFPGQFLHLVRHLVQEGDHDVVFITEDNANVIPGVRKITYRPRPTRDDATDLEQAMARASAVASVAANLRALGYYPDVILGHQGWGEMLDLCDVWPHVPTLGYYEFFYRVEGLDVGFDPEFPLHPDARAHVRAKNAINLLALSNPGLGQTPTLFQHRTYPDWAQPRIKVLPEGIDLTLCRPEPSVQLRSLVVGNLRVDPGDTLLTFAARDLEPYRGFHIFMRALPDILRERPDVKVVVVGGDGVSYGARLAHSNWRKFMMEQIGRHVDKSRIAFPGRVSYADFVTILQRSDVHVYLTYPFVASWSLREAMACGCAIVGSATGPVQEFIEHDRTGLLTPFLDTRMLADAVLSLLTDKPKALALGAEARRYAEVKLRLEDYLSDYRSFIREAISNPGELS